MYTNALDEQFGEILKRINPAKRREYAKKVSVALRAHRSNEILANRNADGSDMEPRKSSKKRRQKNKNSKMFQKMGRRRSLRIKANSNFASVGFQNRNKGLASIHHYGRTIRVNQYGTRVKYPERTMIGIGKAEEEIIMNQFYELVEGAF